MNVTQPKKKFTETNNIFSKRTNLYFFIQTKTLTNGKRNSQTTLNQVDIL